MIHENVANLVNLCELSLVVVDVVDEVEDASAVVGHSFVWPGVVGQLYTLLIVTCV